MAGRAIKIGQLIARQKGCVAAYLMAAHRTERTSEIVFFPSAGRKENDRSMITTMYLKEQMPVFQKNT